MKKLFALLSKFRGLIRINLTENQINDIVFNSDSNEKFLTIAMDEFEEKNINEYSIILNN